jgi:hypothetical protein
MVDSPYTKCPTDYYLNCSKSLKYCYRCAAGKGQPFNQLFYSALHTDDPELLNHPYKETLSDLNRQKALEKSIDKQTKIKSKPSPSKLGYRNEKELVKKVNKQVNKQLSIIKATVASGRINHDGDHNLLEGRIRSDSKLRIKTSTFSVTKEEYEKGLGQGINQWIITTQAGTCYVLTEELYSELIAHIIYLEEKLNG